MALPRAARGGSACAPPPPACAGALPLVAALLLDVHFALPLDMHLFLADGAGNLLGILGLLLADRDLLLDDRRLFDMHLLFLDRDADLLAGPDVGGGGLSPCDGMPLDDDLFPLHRHFQGLVFGDDFLVNTHFARL